MVTYAAAASAAGSPAGLSLTSRRISQPAFLMSSCASTTSVLPPPARGVAVKISRPGEKSPSTSLTSAPSGRSWMTSVPVEIEQRHLDLPPDRRQSRRRCARRRRESAPGRSCDSSRHRAARSSIAAGAAATTVAARTWGAPACRRPVDQHDVGDAVGGQRGGEQRGDVERRRAPRRRGGGSECRSGGRGRRQQRQGAEQHARRIAVSSSSL